MMKDLKILDNAPEGATHFDTEYGFYWMMDREDSQVFSPSTNRFEWDTLSSDFLRSLADIERIVELEKAASTQKGLWVTSDDLQVWRLEQQAKALSEFKFKRCHAGTILENLSDGSHSQEDHDLVYEELKAVEIILSNAANELTGQAKALKESKR
jgi:hypothetical protein